MSYQTLIVETSDQVGIIRLNRPESLNALSAQLVVELTYAVKLFDATDDIGCIVITGNEKAFAAGADIKEMKDKTFMEIYGEDFKTENWKMLTGCRKPVIAAVSGFALGGGCEMAMMCDFIVAAENARFGQPEINLGIIPGIGGTQRLTRLIGKSKAMELCLTGRMIGAEEAERIGLVARVFPDDKLVEEALGIAQSIAEKSLPSVMMCKESVNRAQESSLEEGLLFERRLFQSLFSTNDQKEGMTAFVEKRKPKWSHS